MKSKHLLLQDTLISLIAVEEGIKFMFSKKTTKIDEIFTVDLTLCSKCQIYGDDFVDCRGLLRKYELYLSVGRLYSRIEM